MHYEDVIAAMRAAQRGTDKYEGALRELAAQRDEDGLYTPHPRVAEQIEKAFTYHPPQPGQDYRYRGIREAAKSLAHTISMYTPSSREQSIALAKLEEAVMFANAAIARNE